MKSLADCQILLVDDSPESLMIVEALLSDLCHIHIVDHAAEALARAAEIRPDLILLDVLMPETDGFATCRALKELPQTAQTPVIFLTSLSHPDDRLTGFAAGGVDYVTKPFDAGEIRARVTTHLRLALYEQQQRSHIAFLSGAVRDTEETYRFFADNTSDVLIQCSADGAVCRVNRAWVELTGLERGIPIGHPVWMVASLPDQDLVRQMFEQAVSEGLENFHVTFGVDCIGGKRSLNGVFRLCRGESGDLLGLNGVLSDVSDLLADREALETSLISSRSLAAADLAYLENIAHELNTPLNFISGGVEQLGELVEGRQAKDAVALVEQGLLKLSRLLAGLLDRQKLTTQAASGLLSEGSGRYIPADPLQAPVLIVDDVRSNRMILAFAIKALGFVDVDLADSGEMALELWGRRRHPLVFLDYKMDGIDGYETCRRIRTILSPVRPTVIGVSASALPGNLDQAMSAGFCAQLPKPISKQLIQSTLGMLGWKTPDDCG